jgi:hypothetical protein
MLKIQKLDLLMGNLVYKFQLIDLVQLLFLIILQKLINNKIKIAKRKSAMVRKIFCFIKYEN